MTDQKTTIPKGWKTTTLGEVIDIIGGGTPKTSNPEYWNGNIPWLSVIDFNNDIRWASKTEKYITEEGLNNSSTKLLNVGDLIISARGTVGAFAQLKIPMAFNQSCYGLTAKEHSLNDYIYYSLKYNNKQFKKNVHGAVFDTITRDTFNQIEILLPPLPEQRAIASVLSSFDDKIELLREENKTLEAIAQTIFKEWSRNFKAKDFIKAQEILEFEKGIEVGSSNYLKNKNNLKKPEMFYRVGDIINNGNISSVYCERDLLKDKLFKNDDVLVSFDGTVGRVFIGGVGGYSSGIIKIFDKNKNIKNSFLYFWAKSRQVQKIINLYSEGTTIQHAGKSIPYLEITSNQRKIDKITETLNPIFLKILENLSQIQILSSLRDVLLPKLMKGEIRVKNEKLKTKNYKLKVKNEKRKTKNEKLKVKN